MQQAKFDGFVWERLITYNKLVERWGHSTDVFDGKIYCVGGRISSTLDNNDIYVYDPSASTLKGVLVNSERTPKPRRKHASAMIGNSLLVFGGYDGKYLKDFHYIRLRNEKKIAKADIDLISLDSMSEVHARIY
jgi:N-acetylneuraminic acid mutarotase